MNDSYTLKHMLDIIMIYFNRIYVRKKEITEKRIWGFPKEEPKKSRRRANQKRFYKIVYYTYMYED